MVNGDSKLLNVTKVLNGVVGLLLAIVGYFLVDRDIETKEAVNNIWKEIGSLKITSLECQAQTQKLYQVDQWVLETERDQEQRLRTLERLVK